MNNQALELPPTDTGKRQLVHYLSFDSSEAIPEKLIQTSVIRDYSWLPEKRLVLSSYSTGSSTPIYWRDTEYIPTEKWDSIEGKFESLLRRLIELSREKPPMSSEKTKVKAGPIPGLMIVDLASSDIESVAAVSGILYQVAPNEMTAIAAVTTTGLVILDDLSGEAGMKAITFLPILPQVILVPNEPKVFIENLVKLHVSPADQVEFIAKHGSSLAGLGTGIGNTLPLDLANKALTSALNKLGLEEASKIASIPLDVYKSLIGAAGGVVDGVVSGTGDIVSDLAKDTKETVKDIVGGIKPPWKW